MLYLKILYILLLIPGDTRYIRGSMPLKRAIYILHLTAHSGKRMPGRKTYLKYTANISMLLYIVCTIVALSNSMQLSFIHLLNCVFLHVYIYTSRWASALPSRLSNSSEPSPFSNSMTRACSEA